MPKYIKADNLVTGAQDFLKGVFFVTKGGQQSGKTLALVERLVRHVIQTAPAEDVRPVVHGRWLSSGCGFDCCSECRKVYADGYFTAMGIKPRERFSYCPNCGAEMK